MLLNPVPQGLLCCGPLFLAGYWLVATLIYLWASSACRLAPSNSEKQQVCQQYKSHKILESSGSIISSSLLLLVRHKLLKRMGLCKTVARRRQRSLGATLEPISCRNKAQRESLLTQDYTGEGQPGFQTEQGNSRVCVPTERRSFLWCKLDVPVYVLNFL